LRLKRYSFVPAIHIEGKGCTQWCQSFVESEQAQQSLFVI